MINILTDINRNHTAELREAGSRRRFARRVAKARAGGTGDAVRSTAPAPPGNLLTRF